MIRRLPPAACPIRLGEWRAVFRPSDDDTKALSAMIRGTAGRPHVVLTGSGSAAFALILGVLKSRSDRSEIVVPAYTVPGLHWVIRGAGLKTVLCDVDPETFDYDMGALDGCVGRETLAVVSVHLFGLAMSAAAVGSVARARGSHLIEDAAQAMGTKLRSRPIGVDGVAAFYSFERGKNISGYGGGCAITSDSGIAVAIQEACERLPARSRLQAMVYPFLLGAYALACRPWVYGSLQFAIQRFKSRVRHEHLEYFLMDAGRARVLAAMWNRLDLMAYRRAMNGRYLCAWLSRLKGVRVPRLLDDSVPAFNRLPVILESAGRAESVRKALWGAGIDAPIMFPRAVHHAYPEDFTDRRESFPVAASLAPRVLTLPVHPFVKPRDLETMLAVFERQAG